MREEGSSRNDVITLGGGEQNTFNTVWIVSTRSYESDRLVVVQCERESVIYILQEDHGLQS